MGGLNHRATYSAVWHVELPFAIIVFALIAGTVGVALLRSRWRRGSPSRQPSYPRTEIVYVCLVAAAALSLIGLSVTANASSDPKPALRIHATAFQWCWRFDYEGTDVSVSGTCVGGAIPTLELPTGEPVRISLTSADVVHSMWVPYLRFKMQAIPHVTTAFNVKLTSDGTFTGRCAEYCGLYHYAMHFRVKSVPPARFRSWLHAQEHRS